MTKKEIEMSIEEKIELICEENRKKELPDFTDEQLIIVRLGLEDGLTLEQMRLYASSEFSRRQMQEIRMGFEHGLTPEQVKIYAKPEFNPMQMWEIKKGFENGFSMEEVLSYTDPAISADIMEQKWKALFLAKLKRESELHSMVEEETEIQRDNADKKAPVSIQKEIVERYVFSDSTKKLSQKEKEAALYKMFQEEYQGKSVVYDKEGKSLIVNTKKDTRKKFLWTDSKVWNRMRKIKIGIGFEGDYLHLISNVNFLFSSNERKPGQSKFHKNTNAWHYFDKLILCDEVPFRVLIDVRESKNHEFSIHNISLSMISKERQTKIEEEIVKPVPNEQGYKNNSSSEKTISCNSEKVKNKNNLETKIQDAEKKREGMSKDKGVVGKETEKEFGR